MSLDVSAITINAQAAPEIFSREAEQARMQAVIAAQARDEARSELQARSRRTIDMESVLRDLQGVGATFNKRLSFSLNEKLGQVVVKVIDTETDTVIRELPPKELQNVHERIREVIGLLFDEQA